MKAQFLIYLLLFCNYNFSQTQTQTLVNNVWFLEKFVISQTDFTYTANNSYTHIIVFSDSDNGVLLRSVYCETFIGLYGTITNDLFSCNGIYHDIVGCYLNNDDYNMINTITGFYINPIWDFNFTLIDYNGYKRLELVNSLNDRAIYNNVNLNLPTFNTNSDIVLYPNPVEEILYFKSDFEITNIKIVTIDGKLIESNISLSGNHMNVSNLKKGIYFVEFMQNEKRIRIKIIKK
jgi:hypothetical protein